MHIPNSVLADLHRLSSACPA